MGQTANPKTRNLNIDIAKVLAILAVVGIHFFLHTGLNGMKADNGTMWLGVLLRQSMAFCVPLFLLVTGYLMKNKVWSKSYYGKLGGVLFVYLATSLVYWFFAAVMGGEMNFNGIIGKIIGVGEGSPYAWYVEMYIGLFLLIPFLNAAWHGLKTKRARQVLCVTLIALVSLPRLAVKDVHLPDYWMALWPLMYYFIGAYLREYPPKLAMSVRVILMMLGWGLLGQAVIWQVHANQDIVLADVVGWSYPWVTFYATTLFVVILGMKVTLPRVLSAVVVKISSLTLGTYLFSAIFDLIVYKHILNAGGGQMVDLKLWWLTVPAIFVASLISAMLVDFAYKGILKIFGKFRASRKLRSRAELSD